jgi:hypothetical protein
VQLQQQQKIMTEHLGHLVEIWNTARSGHLGGAGTQTAALAFGGYDGTAGIGATEEYDGSTWSPSNPLNTARDDIGKILWYTNSSISFWWLYYSCYRSNRRI